MKTLKYTCTDIYLARQTSLHMNRQTDKKRLTSYDLVDQTNLIQFVLSQKMGQN